MPWISVARAVSHPDCCYPSRGITADRLPAPPAHPPAVQPIIVLATCHAAPEATPASLVQFFAGPAAAQAGHQQPPQPQQGRLAELLLGDAALDAAAVAAPGIVRMQQPSSAAWQQAVAAAADHVAASVASQTALLLHQQLVAGAAGEQVAGAAAGSPADASPVELPAATAAPAQQEQRAQQKQQQQQEQECNTAEVEQGLRLYEQLLSFQQSLGRSMANKGVAELDYWVRARGGGGGRRRSGGAATGGLLSYSQIAERCQQGAYDSLEALQADAAATAAHILSAAEEQQRQALAQQQRRRQQQAPPSPDPWCARCWLGRLPALAAVACRWMRTCSASAPLPMALNHCCACPLGLFSGLSPAGTRLRWR